MRILVVDDDRAVRDSPRRSLAFNGYQVDLAVDGKDALDAVQQRRPDAMVLDVMMPRLDGLEVCRRMREAGDELPILVLTARDAVSDRVAGLDAGADDYLPKPFALELLLGHPRRVLSRAQILEQVWGYDFPTTGNALEVYIGYLRRKTEADGEPRLIHTVRGVGYVLRDTPP